MKQNIRDSVRKDKPFSFGGVRFDPKCLRKDSSQKDPKGLPFSLGRDQQTPCEYRRRALMSQQDFMLGV